MKVELTLKDIPQLGDAFRHLLPHCKNMTPLAIKQEVVRIVKGICENNNLTPASQSALVTRAKNFISLPPATEDYTTPLLDMILWADRLVASAYKPDRRNDPVDKATKDILDCFYFDFNVQRFDMKINASFGTIRFYVRQHNCPIPYDACRRMLSTEIVQDVFGGAGTSSVAVEGTVSGRVMWINAPADQISILPTGFTHPEVFIGIDKVLPWINSIPRRELQKVVGLQKPPQAQKQEVKSIAERIAELNVGEENE